MTKKRTLLARRACPLEAETVEQRIWTAIRALHAAGKRISQPEVEFLAKVKAGAVRYYVARLLLAGHLKEVKRRPRGQAGAWFTYASYTLERDVGMTAPRLRRDGTPATRGLAREQMWRTVKILREFDARDLSLAASTTACPVTVGNANNFLQMLARGGYMIMSQRNRGRNSLARYRFLPSMNTGPRPPAARGMRVYDHNRGAYMKAGAT